MCAVVLPRLDGFIFAGNWRNRLVWIWQTDTLVDCPSRGKSPFRQHAFRHCLQLASSKSKECSSKQMLIHPNIDVYSRFARIINRNVLLETSSSALSSTRCWKRISHIHIFISHTLRSWLQISPTLPNPICSFQSRNQLRTATIHNSNSNNIVTRQHLPSGVPGTTAIIVALTPSPPYRNRRLLRHFHLKTKGTRTAATTTIRLPQRLPRMSMEQQRLAPFL